MSRNGGCSVVTAPFEVTYIADVGYRWCCRCGLQGSGYLTENQAWQYGWVHAQHARHERAMLERQAALRQRRLVFDALAKTGPPLPPDPMLARCPWCGAIPGRHCREAFRVAAPHPERHLAAQLIVEIASVKGDRAELERLRVWLSLHGDIFAEG